MSVLDVDPGILCFAASATCCVALTIATVVGGAWVRTLDALHDLINGEAK